MDNGDFTSSTETKTGPGKNNSTAVKPIATAVAKASGKGVRRTKGPDIASGTWEMVMADFMSNACVRIKFKRSFFADGWQDLIWKSGRELMHRTY